MKDHALPQTQEQEQQYNANDSNLTGNDTQLCILNAEAASAMKMQLSLQSVHLEHLAPISSLPFLPPLKPRKDMEWEQKEMENLDRIYREYQAREEH